MGSLLHDFRYGIRTLTRSPAFTAIAVVTLALGIGATTAMFTVLSGVLLRPLSYPEPERIVALSTQVKSSGRVSPRVTGGDVLDLQRERAIFQSFATYAGGEMGVQLPDSSEFVATYEVSGDFFGVFGVAPLAGRILNPDDATRSAVIGLPLALRHFGSAQAALGQTLRVENRAYSIAGVVAAGFLFPSATQVWLAGPAQPENTNRTAYNYRAVARLAPGVRLEAANARLSALAAGLEQQFPDSNRDKTFTLTPLRERLVGPVRTTLFFLMGAVALVLLIACANVANLMLARATGRAREMAVRSALGAGRWQIARQLLAESAALALAAGALGVFVAVAGTRILLLRQAAALSLPRLADIRIDWRVLLFALAVSLAASIAFGLAPALQAARVNLSDALKQAGSRGMVGGSSPRLRDALVVAQIAFSLLLVIGAALLFRTFLALTSADLGYRTDSVLVMYAHAPARTLDEYLRVGQFEQELFGRLRALPGVVSVAGAMGLPTGQYGSNGYFAVEGKHAFGKTDMRKMPYADFSLAGPGYFATLGIPLLRGRDFGDADRYGATPVAIVSAALARQVFPGQDPVGQRVMCGFDQESGNWMTIVGVVGDVRQNSPASEPGPGLYMPLLQHPYRANEVQIVLRAAVHPETLIAPVQQAVRGMKPDVAMKFTTMDAMLGDSIAAPRFRMTLAAAFATIALLLSLMGVYAVMAYLTAQRASEFALRAALGASPGMIMRLVLGRAARLTVTGVALGLLLAAAAHRALTTLLFGVKSTDAWTYAAVMLALIPVIVLAAAAPALRAARVDPMVALRNE